jgi:hypothetical protein
MGICSSHHITHPKTINTVSVAFGNNFNNMFNEIWLAKFLFDFWNTEFDKSCPKPGMIFKWFCKNESLYKTLASNKTLNVNELNSLRWIDGPLVITKVKHNELYVRFNTRIQSSNANELAMSKWTDRPLIITSIKNKSIYFQPMWLNVNDIHTWSDTWRITLFMKTQYYINDYSEIPLFTACDRIQLGNCLRITIHPIK